MFILQQQINSVNKYFTSLLGLYFGVKIQFLEISVRIQESYLRTSKKFEIINHRNKKSYYVQLKSQKLPETLQK